MPIMKKYFILAAVALIWASCSKQEIDLDPNQIYVTASMPGSTKATLTNFEEGDMMSLYAVEYNGDNVAALQIGGNYLNNEKMIYTNGKWESERPLYWSNNACDFYGLYPYRQPAAMSDVLFEIETDQSANKGAETLGGYEKSDLMWAKATKITKESNLGTVDMQFIHMMSRVVVKIIKAEGFVGDIPDDVTTHIYNTATTAKVDFTNGTLEKYAYSPKKTITMKKIDNETFEAIVVPQFIERSTPLIEITMGGIAYLMEYSISFRPGEQHTISVTLLKSPEQERIDITIDGEVDPWGSSN